MSKTAATGNAAVAMKHTGMACAIGTQVFDHIKRLFLIVILQIEFETQRGKMDYPQLPRDVDAHPQLEPRTPESALGFPWLYVPMFLLYCS